MTSFDMQASIPFFLRLPVELRLQIYDYAVTPRSITIAGSPGYWDKSIKDGKDEAGAVRGQEVWLADGYKEDLMIPDCILNTVSEKSCGTRIGKRAWHERGSSDVEEDVIFNQADKEAIQGIENRVAQDTVMKTAEELPLSFKSPETAGLLYSTILALHLTHPQIHEELLEHRRQYDAYYRHLDLAISYPAGITILADHYSHLLKQAKKVTILGLTAFDDNAGLHFDRMQDMKEYVWESVAIVSKDLSQIPPEDLLARHQVNCLATTVARLLGKVAYDEEEEYRERHDVEPIDPGYAARKLSFSSNPPVDVELDSEDDTHDIDNVRTPSPTEILTIDPPPPTSPTARKRPSSPSPPLENTPTLHLRIFHPRPAIKTPASAALVLPDSRGIIALPHAHPPVRSAAGPTILEPFTQVWSHVFSPITITMSNIYGGHIALSVGRGEKGVGVAAVVKGNAGLGRQVSSRWPVLGKGEDEREWLFERKKKIDEDAGSVASRATAVAG